MSIVSATQPGPPSYESQCDRPSDHGINYAIATERDQPSVIDEWRKALDHARPTLQADLRSREAFNRLITDAISYGTGSTPTIPDLEADALTSTAELEALSHATGSVMRQARELSQLKLFSDQLQRAATDLRAEWQRTMRGLEPSGSETREGGTGTMDRNASDSVPDHRSHGDGTEDGTSGAPTSIPSDAESSAAPGGEPASKQDWAKSGAPRKSSSKLPNQPDSESSSTETSPSRPVGDAAASVASVLNGLAEVCTASGKLAGALRPRPRVYLSKTSSPPTSFVWRQERPRQSLRVTRVPAWSPGTRRVTTTTTHRPTGITSRVYRW